MGKLRIFHGGEFSHGGYLMRGGGKFSEVVVDPDLLSLDDLVGIVMTLGYAEEKIAKIYLSKPGWSFQEGLVALDGDDQIRVLIALVNSCKFVKLYVKHTVDDEKDSNGCGIVGADNNLKNESHVEDEELEMRKKKKIKLKHDILDERKAMEENGNANGDERVEKEAAKGEDLPAEKYHDSNIAHSRDTESEGDNEGKKRSRRRKKMDHNPEYNPENPRTLLSGMSFPSKKDLVKAVTTYKVLGGYNLRVLKSDNNRYQLECKAEGCEWRLWSSKVGTEEAFMIKTLDKQHTCIPYSFEVGQRTMSVTWMAEHYRDLYRVNPSLTDRELQEIVKVELNYKASMSMCARARRKALASCAGLPPLEPGDVPIAANVAAAASIVAAGSATSSARATTGANPQGAAARWFNFSRGPDKLPVRRPET